jgi:hypothetical protein
VQWTGLQAGTFSASLTVTDAAGDTDTGVLSLEVVPQECPEVQPELTLGLVADDELVEASGLIVSRRDPEILWTHNDSGDTSRLFALDRDGAALGTWSFDLPDSDWEDLAWGQTPTPTPRCSSSATPGTTAALASRSRSTSSRSRWSTAAPAPSTRSSRAGRP